MTAEVQMSVRSVSADFASAGVARLIRAAHRAPILEPQEEYVLAKHWRDQGDRNAGHRLVTSHLRLVARVAKEYRGYGLPFADLLSEGAVGLMQAVNASIRIAVSD
jgi:RNA polymerase sigma-32 factor